MCLKRKHTARSHKTYRLRMNAARYYVHGDKRGGEKKVF